MKLDVAKSDTNGTAAAACASPADRPVVALASGSAFVLMQARRAARELGGCFLPLPPHSVASDRDRLLEETGARLVEDLGELRAVLSPSSAEAPPWRSHDPCLLVATSGSQGVPKAVSLSWGALRLGARAACERLAVTARDRWLCCMPLHHVAGLAILERVELAGASLLLHDGFDADAVWQVLRAGQASHVSLVPTMLRRLLDIAGERPPSGLTYALLGGGPIDENLVRQARQAGWPLALSYGMSEAGSQVATLTHPASDWREGDVGTPLPHLRLRIDEPDADGVGVIALSGPGLMRGYARADRVSGSGLIDGWLCTGDLGRLDEQGHLHIRGRHDEVLISGGENVHPLPVEALMRSAPGVCDAGLGARPDPRWGQRLVAVVSGEVQPEALLAWLGERLPPHQRPRELLSVAEVPRSTMGKLDRRRLAELITAAPGHFCPPGADQAST